MLKLLIHFFFNVSLSVVSVCMRLIMNACADGGQKRESDPL